MEEERMRRLAASYVPEWRFDREEPDLGSALALLFEEMSREAGRSQLRLMDKYRAAFFNRLGAEMGGGKKAKGFLTFNLEKPDLPEALVPAGTEVLGADGDQNGVKFLTEEDLYVSGAVLGGLRIFRGTWHILFLKPPVRGLISLLVMLEERLKGMESPVKWTYYGEQGWTPILVSDGTKGLTRTGILRFAAPSDFKSVVWEEEEGWWLRAEAAKDHRRLPQPAGVYLNGVRAIAAEPGVSGNLLAGSGWTLDHTIGFVSKIANPDLMFGGEAVENPESCLKRNGSLLRHGNRAVTPKDMERMALASSSSVLRAVCFSGYQGNGDRKSGAVTLVILQKDWREGRRYFHRLQEQLEADLRDCLDPVLAAGGGPDIIAPCFAGLDVEGELAVSDYDKVTAVRLEAEKELERYLNPVDGGPDHLGWEMGELPEDDQIFHLLSRTAGVTWVRRMYLRFWLTTPSGPREASREELERCPWVLPCCGRVSLSVTVLKLPEGGG